MSHTVFGTTGLATRASARRGLGCWLTIDIEFPAVDACQASMSENVAGELAPAPEAEHHLLAIDDPIETWVGLAPGHRAADRLFIEIEIRSNQDRYPRFRSTAIYGAGRPLIKSPDADACQTWMFEKVAGELGPAPKRSTICWPSMMP